MIKLTILYPDQPDAKFDWDYYLHIHMPESIRLHGDALKGVSINKGINTGIEGVDYTYIAITTLLFESIVSFIEAFTPHAAALQSDMVNYTNIKPLIQFNEVMM